MGKPTGAEMAGPVLESSGLDQCLPIRGPGKDRGLSSRHAEWLVLRVFRAPLATNDLSRFRALLRTQRTSYTLAN